MNDTEKATPTRKLDPEQIVTALSTTAEVALKQGIEIGKRESQAVIAELLEAAKIGLTMAQDLEDTSTSKMTQQYWDDKDQIVDAITSAESLLAASEVESRIKEEITFQKQSKGENNEG